ncbi:MAG: cytochrome c [Rubrivivax sp.]
MHTRLLASTALLALAAPLAQAEHQAANRMAAQSLAAFPTATATLPPEGEGRRLYLKLNCYGCHGMAAGGGMGPKIVHAEYNDVAEVLKQGEDGGMRSYKSYVTTVDINNIAAYLRSIGTPSEPKWRDWWVPVPTK